MGAHDVHRYPRCDLSKVLIHQFIYARVAIEAIRTRAPWDPSLVGSLHLLRQKVIGRNHEILLAEVSRPPDDLVGCRCLHNIHLTLLVKENIVVSSGFRYIGIEDVVLRFFCRAATLKDFLDHQHVGHAECPVYSPSFRTGLT